MNLILHHVLKDLRALRLPIALWLGVLAADVASQVLKLDRFVRDADQLTMLTTAWTLTGLGLMVFGWVLAAMIVQEDPLDSPSAFWLTRPLCWKGLLASKLLLAASLFLIVPAAGAAAISAANGARGAILAQYVVERLAVGAALLVPVLVAASVAHNLPRMVLYSTEGFFVYLALHTALMALPWLWVNRPARATGVLVALAVVIGGGLALLASQYKTRATRRTIVLACATLVLAVAAGDLWPWAIGPQPARPPLDPRLLSPSSVRLSIDADSLRRSREEPAPIAFASSPARPTRETGATFVAVRATLRVEGLPPGWMPDFGGGTGSVRLGEREAVTGNVLPVQAVTFPVFARGDVEFSSRAKSALEHALGVRVVNTGKVSEGVRADLFALPASAYVDQRGERASFEGTVTVEARRVIVSKGVPLRPGAACRLDGEEMTVLDVRPGVGRLATVRRARTDVSMGLHPTAQPALRNRRTGEAVFLGEFRDASGPMGFGTSDMQLVHSSLRLPQRLAVDIDARWLQDAELVLAAFETVGAFEKRLTLKDFELPNMYY
jgi:hypothetical protein